MVISAVSLTLPKRFQQVNDIGKQLSESGLKSQRCQWHSGNGFSGVNDTAETFSDIKKALKRSLESLKGFSLLPGGNSSQHMYEQSTKNCDIFKTEFSTNFTT
jgi:hypothetical protein